MQPRPMAETSRLLFPSLRFCTCFSFEPSPVADSLHRRFFQRCESAASMMKKCSQPEHRRLSISRTSCLILRGWLVRGVDRTRFPRLGCLDAGHLFQVTLANLLVADFEFLDFPAHGHGKAVHEANIFWDFEVHDFSFAEVANFFCATGFAGFQAN